VRIKVISRGETVFDAEPKHLAPAIREDAEAGRGNGDWEIIRQMVSDCTEEERGWIDHGQYAIVTEDDRTPLWEGWLDGRDEPAPDDGAATIACLTAALRDIRDANPDAPAGAYVRDRAALALGTIPPGGNRP
jgi:hypothetical protein